MKNKLIYLLALLMALLSSSAFADAPQPQYQGSTSYGGAYTTAWDFSASAVCSALLSYLSGKQPAGYTVTMVGTPPACAFRQVNGAYNAPLGSSVQSRSWCKTGSAPDLTKPLDQQCPNTCPAAGSSAGSLDVTSAWTTGPETNSAYASKVIPDGGWSTSSFCVGGCTVTPSGPPTNSVQMQSPGPNGYYEVVATGPFQHTGATCTPSASSDPRKPQSEPTTPPPEKNRCPLGTKQTGTDSAGIPICTGDPAKPPENKATTTTKTTNADGSTTEITKEKTTNSDGSTTEKTITKTTGADGSVTTSEQTNTGTRPDGKQGTSDSTDKDRMDLCKQNPTLNICRNSEISGTCRNISCSGDAIACAIARKQAEEACKRQEDEDAVKASSYHAAGVAALAGTGNENLPNPANVTPTEIGSLNATGWMGGGACLSDKTIHTAAGDFVIPLSDACDVLVLFRYLFMFVASMVSFRMLSRAFLGD